MFKTSTHIIFENEIHCWCHKITESFQMFSKLPQTISMSEPWGLFFLHILYRKDKITEDAYLKLLESCVKIQFKPCLQKEIKRYSILNNSIRF